MTKEKQIQIMKPIKVLSLVLLALLLLVPAASAETYTLIDEDLVFSSDGDDVFEGVAGYIPLEDPDVVESENYVLLDVIFSSEYFEERDIDISIYDGGTWSFGGRSGLIEIQPDGSIYLEGLNPNGFEYRTFYASDMLTFEGWFCPSSEYYDEQWVYTPEEYARYGCGLYICPWVKDVSWGVNYVITGLDGFEPGPVTLTPAGESIQHVTVTYDDETSDYTVIFDETTFDRDISVTGYLFGVFPIHFTGIGWRLHSDAVSYTVPARFFVFDLYYTAEVVYNGDRKSVSWNLDSLPETVTPPEPDPPFPDPDPGLPDDPDTFDPTTPFPTPPYNPSGLPDKIPTSLKELIGFDLTEIKDRFKESTPFYSNAFDFIASAIEAVFDFLFVLIAGTLGVLIGFLSDPLTEIYNFIVWTSSVVFSFMDFLIIPNHIMSFLADFVPVEIVNLALAALGLDILLNVLSIAIPDFITAYKSTVRTYYHKVDHGIQKGGKK